ncbi:helix-turn-helix domain-containing protein [Sporomusa malonica]|uniref:Helix-turn-helix n=1 Tax=Sporomusa malonica TaxID=112901 RepID=A0A1W2AUV6_9FIRM|nr:helix-turn-helix transcriptional regulator [Sporomusa malonica]SMC64310.1 Helix-turn-helix [Sporomusa malonica]
MEDNNISQYALGKNGVSQSTINGILSKGKSPTQRTIKKIYKALGVTAPESIDNKKEVAEWLPLVLEEMDNLDDLTEKEKVTRNSIKNMTSNEQRESFLFFYEKYQKLSIEHRQALDLIVKSLPSSDSDK